jgi:BRCT domain type II-containing protein
VERRVEGRKGTRKTQQQSKAEAPVSSEAGFMTGKQRTAAVRESGNKVLQTFPRKVLRQKVTATHLPDHPGLLDSPRPSPLPAGPQQFARPSLWIRRVPG